MMECSTLPAPVAAPAPRGLVPESASVTRYEEATEPLADLTAVRLFVAVPTHGGACSVITSSALIGLAGALDRAGAHWQIKLMNGEMVARARNRFASHFRKLDFTHLLFIDSDIGFEPADVLAMLRVNLRVVGGVYPLKDYAWDRMVGASREEMPSIGLDYCYNATGTIVEQAGQKQIAFRALRGCVEVGEIGTGFLLIQRETFELFAAQFPQLSYADDTPDARGQRITTFFDYAIHDDRYLSEDFYFCRKWRDIGGRVWAYPKARLSHAGMHVFAGAFDRVVHSVEVYKPVAPMGE